MSPTTRPGYKQTDVGTIPEDWDVRAVCEMGDVLTGKALAVAAPGKPRPYLRTKNVFDGRIDVDDVLSMPMTDAEFNHFETEENDLLLNEGQSLELVGRCARYRGEYGHPVAIQNQLIRFRANTGTCPLFAEQLFRHCQHTGVFARIALKTTSIAHLGGKRFGALRLAWPCDVVEQKRIGTALADADAAVAHTVDLIAKKQSLKQAAMQELLSGETRLQGFSGQWNSLAFGNIATIRNAKVGGSTALRDMRCVELECIASHGIGRLLATLDASGKSSKYRFAKGDVLFGRLRAYLRKHWLADFDGCCTTELWPLMPTDTRLCNVFLYLIVQTPEFVSAASVSYGTHMPRSDWWVIANLLVPLPPLAEQHAIAQVLSDMDAEIAALERQRDKTKQLKQAMMQELLTGKTRLA